VSRYHPLILSSLELLARMMWVRDLSSWRRAATTNARGECNSMLMFNRNIAYSSLMHSHNMCLTAMLCLSAALGPMISLATVKAGVISGSIALAVCTTISSSTPPCAKKPCPSSWPTLMSWSGACIPSVAEPVTGAATRNA
jgi:hypothetical protein